MVSINARAPLSGTPVRKQKIDSFPKRLVKDKELILLVLPGVILFFLFKLIPIYGILMAFKDYRPNLGMLGSEWAGFKHFIRFVNGPYFYRSMRNNIMLGVYNLVFYFPAPILLALLLNELRSIGFKRVVQTVSYMPHFISIVIVIGFLNDMFGMTGGVVNDILETLGLKRVDFFGQPQYFRSLYVFSDVWKGVGYSSILYLASIAGINPELYESAHMDGANRPQKMWYITLPSILPTIVILFIFNSGSLIGSGDTQKILLMYSPAIYETADTVGTYTYREGIEGGSYSYSTAIGVFMSVISFVIVYITNRISKTVNEISLW